MNLKNIFYFILATVIITNCKNVEPKYKELATAKFTIQNDSAILNEQLLHSLRFQNIGDSSLAYWIDYSTGAFYTYTIESKIKRLIKLPDEFKKILKQNSGSQFQNDYKFLNPNNIGFYFWEDLIFYKINIFNQKFVTYKIGDSLRENNINYVTPMSAFHVPFLFVDNKVYFTSIYNQLHLITESAIKEFNNSPNTFCFNINEKFELNTFGEFPQNYKEGNMFNHHYAYRCTNSQNQVILSYPANDSVFIYTSEGEFIEKLEAKSKYSNGFEPISISKKKNISEFREYAITNSFYQELFYDKYRNRYYRVFKKKQPYLTSAGKIRKGNNIEWTLVVFNSTFERICEIEIDPSIYSPQFIIPSEKGVYISNRYEKWIEEQAISLTLITLNI